MGVTWPDVTIALICLVGGAALGTVFGYRTGCLIGYNRGLEWAIEEVRRSQGTR